MNKIHELSGALLAAGITDTAEFLARCLRLTASERTLYLSLANTPEGLTARALRALDAGVIWNPAQVAAGLNRKLKAAQLGLVATCEVHRSGGGRTSSTWRLAPLAAHAAA